MSKTAINLYSKTPASNTDVDGINIDEGMAPSNVNNALRAIMSHLKEQDDGTASMLAQSLVGTLQSLVGTLQSIRILYLSMQQIIG